MCIAPGIAPCSYSSGSRTSSTTVPGARRRSSGAGGVDLADLRSWSSASSSRKLRHGRKPTSRSGFRYQSDRRIQAVARARDHVREIKGSTSLIEPRSTTSARSSISVGSAFRMITDAPLRLRDRHHAGGRDTRSASCRPRAARRTPRPPCSARSMTSGTRLWPNEIVADLRIPPQVAARRVLLAGIAPGRAPRSIGAAVAAAQAHHSCASCRAPRPPGSDRCPPLWCSPSTFWVTSGVQLPRFSSSTIARWPALGSAVQAGESRRPRHACFRTSGSLT